jgi:hypothetical protein
VFCCCCCCLLPTLRRRKWMEVDQQLIHLIMALAPDVWGRSLTQKFQPGVKFQPGCKVSTWVRSFNLGVKFQPGCEVSTWVRSFNLGVKFQPGCEDSTWVWSFNLGVKFQPGCEISYTVCQMWVLYAGPTLRSCNATSALEKCITPRVPYILHFEIKNIFYYFKTL